MILLEVYMDVARQCGQASQHELDAICGRDSDAVQLGQFELFNCAISRRT